MSNRPKQPFEQMFNTASRLCAHLSKTCQRIEIAGSLRRRISFCSDIEILAIPVPVLNLLGEPTETTELDLLLGEVPVTFTKNGPKYKQFHFDGTHAPFWVDLFIQTPQTWGVNFVLRTGPADFSKRMVTPIKYGGYMPDDMHVQDARVWRNGKPLDTPEETDVFTLYGMDFIPPENRK